MIIASWWGVLFGQESERAACLRELTRELVSVEETGAVWQGSKCGTHILVQGIVRWPELSLTARMAVEALGQRPIRQTSRVSPLGRFRVHYDTSGIHQPAMLDASGQRRPGSFDEYVDSVAAVFDHCWEVEVIQLGYPPPPEDGMEGGGPEYDVYVEELGTSLFGATWFDRADILRQGRRGRDTTFITVDNDFRGLRTDGLDGLRVTAAHEFYHAIQIGTYGFWTTVPNWDAWFYELASVWMEKVVYDDINDYLFDLPLFFRLFRDAQQRSWSMVTYTSSFAGYERSIWARFLEARFGRDFLRRVWEGMRERPSLESLEALLRQHGTDLSSEFLRFSAWNYFTADRADPVRYDPEADRFPRYLPNMTVQHGGVSTSLSQQMYPLSMQILDLVTGGDTISAVVANVDAAGARRDAGILSGFTLRIASSPGAGLVQNLNSGLSMTLDPADAEALRIVYLSGATRGDAGTKEFPAPNPLRLAEHPALMLPLAGGQTGEADVLILNSALDRTYAGRHASSEWLGKRYVAVPTSGLGQRVSSGVHFVVLSIGGTEYHWKIMIVP